MTRVIVTILLLASCMAPPAHAIETNGSYDTTQPTSSSVPYWNTGWGSNGVSGWNYVGAVNGCSGVYLGNGWVLTAAHVGSGNFQLAGTLYTFVPNTAQSISNTDGTADLTLFKIKSPPALPPLTLSTSLPVAFAPSQAGSTVVMLGFGGSGSSLSWGYDTMTEIDQLVTPQNYTYVSNDFFTDNGTVTRGSSSITNNSNLVTGDSGGGDFTYNSTTQRWELTGINEVTGSYSGYNPVTDDYYYGTGTFSGFVQLDTYAAQINATVSPDRPSDTPTLPLPALLLLACLLLFAASRSFRPKPARA